LDLFNAMRVFTRIVELGGFAKAADSLQLPRASVTVLIKQLEAHLGVQLLQRTTRQVSPTLDGAAYYQRCVQLLSDLEETEAVFSASRQSPRGTLSIDMPSGIGRLIVIPALPTFTARYPQIELEIGLNDRPVDLIREGIDCVLRGGDALDDSLVARPLAVFLCALPDRRAGWSINELLFMCWTRETGVIPAALAGLLLGMKAPGAQIIASVTFIAILMTILIQAPTTKWLGRKLGLLEDGDKH